MTSGRFNRGVGIVAPLSALPTVLAFKVTLVVRNLHDLNN
jgi:hypothetical protein